MNSSSDTLFRALLRAIRPASLLSGMLLYALGGGIAYFLGEFINWPVYWIGQGIVTVLQISSYLLREYFDRAGQPPFQYEVGKPKEDQPPPPPPRLPFLQIALTTMTIGAVLTVLLFAQGALNPGAFVILVVAFALAVAYAVPPFRLVYSGYGELLLSILVANLFPAFCFLLQTGELHRLLAMLTFPLTFLYLASALARSLQHYMEDLRLERHTMLTRLGWQRGMNIHNILVAAAYLMLAFAVMLGLPQQLALPAFLSMPVGLYQIWQINGIANGAKPHWRILAITAMASMALMAYFINLALWTS